MVTSIIDCDIQRALQLATDVGSLQAGATVAGDNRYCATATATRGTPVHHSAELQTGLAEADIVYIGTTPGVHAELVAVAVAAGKHVLLEKPLAASSADADAIVAATESGNGVFVTMDIGEPAAVRLAVSGGWRDEVEPRVSQDAPDGHS